MGPNPKDWCSCTKKGRNLRLLSLQVHRGKTVRTHQGGPCASQERSHQKPVLIATLDCCCSVAQLCPTLCDPMDCSTPGLPVLNIAWNLPKFMSFALVMPSSHLVLWRPLLLLPSIVPSIRDYSSESAVRIRWPKYWSFSFSISASNEKSGLISLKMDWLDLLAVQGTLRSLLQHHSSKASVLWCSAFFTVLLSQQYVTTGKTKALTKQTLVGRVISLLFNTLSRFVITFLLRSNHLLISRLLSPSTVILEPKKRKSVTASMFSPSIAMKWWDWMPWS